MFAILNVDLRIDECPCTGQTWRYLEAVQDTGIFRCGIFTNRDFTIYVLQLTFAYIHVPFATLGICGDNCKKLQKFSFAKHVDLFLKLNAYCFPTSPALVSTERIHHHLHPFFSMWCSPFQTQNNHQNILVWFPVATVKTCQNQKFELAMFCHVVSILLVKKGRNIKTVPFCWLAMCRYRLNDFFQFDHLAPSYHSVYFGGENGGPLSQIDLQDRPKGGIIHGWLSVFSIENLETFENHRMNIS